MPLVGFDTVIHLPDIDKLSVISPRYSESFTFSIEGSYSFTRQGTWYSRRTGLLKTILGDQSPHSGAGESGKGSGALISIGISESDRIGWVRQEFGITHQHIPKVVATAEHRITEWIQRVVPRVERITAPEVSIRRVGLYVYHCKTCDNAWIQFVHETHPRCTDPDCGSADTEEITFDNKFNWLGWYQTYHGWKKKVGDWGAFNWLRDAIAYPLAWVNYYMLGKDSIFRLLDVIDEYIDRIENSVHSTLDETINMLTTKVNRSVDGIETAIQNIQPDIYSIWGIPKGTAIAPVHIRNVKKDSFEWLALGPMKIDYIAISLK